MRRLTLLGLTGLLIVGCTSPYARQHAKRITSRYVLVPNGKLPVGPVPIDRKSKRPLPAWVNSGTRMAEKSLYTGIIGSRLYPALADGGLDQEDYLNRLRCPGGAPPTWARNGRLGARDGIGDQYSTDLFTIECPDVMPFLFYMHMSRGMHTTDPIPGFTLVADSMASLLPCPPPAPADTIDGEPDVFLLEAVQFHPIQAADLGTVGLVRQNVRGMTQGLAFIVDTFGAVEPESIRPGPDGPTEHWEAVRQWASQLWYSPGEHHRGCRVRTFVRLKLRIDN